MNETTGPTMTHLSPQRHAAFRDWGHALKACILGVVALVFLPSAQAVPSFARQTGQSCVACHAGGQFPELTPYGRLFKMTGYTNGARGNPLAAMVVGDWTKTKNNSDGAGGALSNSDKKFIFDFGSLFVAGKITDNVGGFSQFTYNRQDDHVHSDNLDVRYADQNDVAGNQLIWGVTLHNNPSVQDVWNTAPAWAYPYINSSTGAFGGMPYATLLEQQLQVAGTGAYVYANKTWYAEFSTYRTADKMFNVLSMGSKAGDPNYPLTYLSGSNPYARVAYTREWDASNLMLGAFAMNANVLPLDGSNRPVNGPSTHYRDTGVDAQYQFLMDPHTITAQARYIHERINDDIASPAYGGPAVLNSFRLKGSYVYQAKYGASLAMSNITGSADAGAYASGNQNFGSASNTPNTRLWTPEIFWLPVQNVRVGLQYNHFTRYNGKAVNYDGFGRNARDNNTLFLYLWAAY